jgi:hypothetical protein
VILLRAEVNPSRERRAALAFAAASRCGGARKASKAFSDLDMASKKFGK